MSQALQKFQALSQYDELLRAVRKVMAEGRTRAEQAVEQERVRTAWEIGKLIDEHILQHKERAAYGSRVIIRLAKDLGRSETELKYMLEFYRAYPIRRPAGELSWSQHEALLAINEPKQRKALADRASRENWKRDRLRQEIRQITREMKKEKNPSVAETVAPGLPAVETLTAEPGKLRTYRVIRAKAGPLKGELVLDLGFATYHRPAKGLSRFKEGDLVSIPSPQPSPKVRGGSEGEQRRGVSSPSGRGKGEGKATTADLFTYTADIYEVLDGDTVNAVVDLGFNIFTQQTLRLRGIDAPELMTADGREAKEALEKMIAESPKLRAKSKNSLSSSHLALSSPVLIRTTKSDKYDRYLVDIWNGDLYINQELVNQGHAVIVEE